jgi:hypothetical protein
MAGSLIALLFGLFFAVALSALRIRWKRQAMENKLHGSQRSLNEGFERLAGAFDGVKLKIVIGELQVVAGMAIQFQTVLPAFFIDVANIFSLLALDLLKIFDFGCSLPDQTHYTSLALTTTLPLGACFCIWVFYTVMTRKVLTVDDTELLQDLRILCYNLFLIVLFLVYPSVSSKILQTWQCDQLDDGTTWIKVDHSVSCLTAAYQGWVAYSVIMFFVFVLGIPVVYTYLLVRQRKLIDPPSGGRQGIALQVRDKNPLIQHTKFLWGSYKPRFFWFEVWELVRKLLQTSALVFAAPGSSKQMLFQLAVTLCSVVVLHVCSPYLKMADMVLALLAQWCIFIIALLAMIIKLDNTASVPTYGGGALDVVLLVVFLAGPCLAGAQIVWDQLSLIFPAVYRTVLRFTSSGGSSSARGGRSFRMKPVTDEAFDAFVTDVVTDEQKLKMHFLRFNEDEHRLEALRGENETLSHEAAEILSEKQELEVQRNELLQELASLRSHTRRPSNRPSATEAGAAAAEEGSTFVTRAQRRMSRGLGLPFNPIFARQQQEIRGTTADAPQQGAGLRGDQVANEFRVHEEPPSNVRRTTDQGMAFFKSLSTAATAAASAAPGFMRQKRSGAEEPAASPATTGDKHVHDGGATGGGA